MTNPIAGHTRLQHGDGGGRRGGRRPERHGLPVATVPRPRGVLGGEREAAGRGVEHGKLGRVVGERGVVPALPLRLALGRLGAVVFEEVAVEHGEGRVVVNGIKGKPVRTII